MGSIQSNINQTLGVLGAMAQLSPQLRENQEVKAEQRKIDKINKVGENLIENIKEKGLKTPEEADKAIEEYNELAGYKEEGMKKKFEASPSVKKYGELISERERMKKNKDILYNKKSELDEEKAIRDMEEEDRINQELYPEVYGNSLEAKQQQANMKSQKIKNTKTKQRRNFMDYISKQKTSYDMSVGDLPKKQQKIIASQYNSKERKNMMDMMDKEANKNGK